MAVVIRFPFHSLRPLSYTVGSVQGTSTPAPAEEDDMDIVCLQTADPDIYYDLLYQTSKTVRLYCNRHGIRYESYIGIKRGYFAWHATFNRIFLIKELLDSGFRGWICYIDADAYVANL